MIFGQICIEGWICHCKVKKNLSLRARNFEMIPATQRWMNAKWIIQLKNEKFNRLMIFIRKLFIRIRGARNTIDQNPIRITFNNQPKIKVILMIYEEEAHYMEKLRTQLKNLKVGDVEEIIFIFLTLRCFWKFNTERKGRRRKKALKGWDRG